MIFIIFVISVTIITSIIVILMISMRPQQWYNDDDTDDTDEDEESDDDDDENVIDEYTESTLFVSHMYSIVRLSENEYTKRYLRHHWSLRALKEDDIIGRWRWLSV